MELAFNVPNAGPLSQISVHIMSFTGAMQIAIGAHGWWRARQNSQALTATLESAGAVLISTSSFNLPLYERLRTNEKIRGVCIERGVVTKVELPKASTAKMGDSGQKCLRALTTGLLCLFSGHAVIQMLAEVIPQELLSLDQDGVSIKFEGPLRTSLSEYVRAVEIEEDSSNIRQEILQEVDQEVRTLGCGIKIQNTNWNSGSDFIKGRAFLKWCLAPLQRREAYYLTRSLLTWTLAAVLSQLGFQTIASQFVVFSQYQLESYLNQERNTDFDSTVYLVIDPNLASDPMEAEVVTSRLNLNDGICGTTFKARILPIRAIPWFAFHLLPGIDDRAIEQLAEIWDYTFETVRKSLKGPTMHTGNSMWCIPEDEREDCLVRNPWHKSLLRVWCPHLSYILKKPMTEFIKFQPELQEIADELESHGNSLRGNDWKFPPPSISSLYNSMTSIVLATLYAMVSLVTIDNGQLAGAYTEVGFNPYTAFSSRVGTWASSIGGKLIDRGRGWGPRADLFEMMTGTFMSRLSINRTSNDTLPHTEHSYGCQQNGVLLVSELLVRPTIDNVVRCMHRISIGQAITLPSDQNGFLRASAETRGIKVVSFPGKDVIGSLGPLLIEGSRGENGLRVDMEPDWEQDCTRVAMTLRHHGEVLETMSPTTVNKCIGDGIRFIVPCSCRSPSSQVKVPTEDRWQSIAFTDLLIHRGKQIRFPNGTKLVVDVGDDMLAQLFVLYSTIPRLTVLAKECMLCAYSAISAAERDNQSPTGIQTILLINGIP